MEAAAEEGALFAFACCPHDRNLSVHGFPTLSLVRLVVSFRDYGIIMQVSTSYELNGRVHQKRRTRDALIAAARDLVAEGETPTVERAAEAASISRATAYRYFPSQHALLVAAHPETVTVSLLPDDPPDDAAARLDLVIDAFFA